MARNAWVSVSSSVSSSLASGFVLKAVRDRLVTHGYGRLGEAP